MGTKRTSCGPRYRKRNAASATATATAAAGELSPSARSPASSPPPQIPPAQASAAGSDPEVDKDPILKCEDPSAETQQAVAAEAANLSSTAVAWEPTVEKSPGSSKSCRGGVSAIRDFIAATVSAAASPTFPERTVEKTPGSSKSDWGDVLAIRGFPPGRGSNIFELMDESKEEEKNNLKVETSGKEASLTENNHKEKLDAELHSRKQEAMRAVCDGLEHSKDHKEAWNLKVPPEGVIICGLMAFKDSPWSNKKKPENKPFKQR